MSYGQSHRMISPPVARVKAPHFISHPPPIPSRGPPPPQSPSLFPFLQPRRRHSPFSLSYTLSLNRSSLLYNCCSTAAPVVALLLSTPGRQSHSFVSLLFPLFTFLHRLKHHSNPLVAVPSLGPVTFPPKIQGERPFARGKTAHCTTFHPIPFFNPRGLSPVHREL